VHRTIWLVLSVAQARFAAAKLALLNLGGGDGESRAFFRHDGSLVIARRARNGGFAMGTLPATPRCAA